MVTWTASVSVESGLESCGEMVVKPIVSAFSGADVIFRVCGIGMLCSLWKVSFGPISFLHYAINLLRFHYNNIDKNVKCLCRIAFYVYKHIYDFYNIL